MQKNTNLHDNSHGKLILLIIIIATAAPFVGDLYVPSLPAITDSFNVSPSLTKFSVSAYFIGLSLSVLFYGPLSDHYGRKKILQAGLLLALLGTLYLIAFPTILNLLIVRVILGFGMGVSMLFRPLMRDHFNQQELSIIGSYVAISFSVIGAITPILGGFIQYYFDWQTNFWITLVYLVIIIIVVSLIFQEKNFSPSTEKKHAVNIYFSIIKKKSFMLYSICGGLIFSGLIAYLTVSPFLFQTVIGLNSLQYGLLSLWIIAALITASIVNRILIQHLTCNQLILLGLVIFISGAILLLISYSLGYVSVLGIMPPLFVVFFGYTFIFTNAFAAAFASIDGYYGYATAIYSLTQASISSIISALIALFPVADQYVLAIILLLLGCGGLVCWFKVRDNSLS